MDFHVEPFETCRPSTSFVVKMYFDYEKNYSTRENFELLCDLNLILDLPCVIHCFMISLNYLTVQ
jgi:hypothetical protein